MTYLLDSDIVARFQDAGQLAALCRAAALVPLQLVEDVYDELTLERSHNPPAILRKKREARRFLADSALAVRGLEPDTHAHRVFNALRAGRTSQRDRGEAASVALACDDRSLVFVCGDRNATLSALGELHGTGERVLRPHVFLRRLIEARALRPVEALACAECFVNFGIRPSWWTPWLGDLRAA
jgi:hypothetical protein